MIREGVTNKSEIARQIKINRVTLYNDLKHLIHEGILNKDYEIIENEVIITEDIKAEQSIKGETRDLDYVLDACLEIAIEKATSIRAFIYDTKIVVLNLSKEDNDFIEYMEANGFKVNKEEIGLRHGFGAYNIRAMRRLLQQYKFKDKTRIVNSLNMMIEKNRLLEEKWKNTEVKDLIVDFGNQTEWYDNDIELFKAKLELNELMIKSA